ncbi:MAG: hypothetical protein ACON5P_03270 [Candidatus Puniceispirillaceae bacterium]
MLKRVGLLITGVSFLATGSCLAGGDPDLKAEEVSASTPNGAATATTNASAASGANTGSASGTANNNSGSNSGSASSGSTSSGSNNSAAQQDDSFDAVENDELVIDVDSLADGDGLGSIQVQWQISEDGSNWMIIPGAIQSSFTPRDSEVGRYLRVQISYVDGQGNAEIMISPASKPVLNVNDRPVGMPELQGDAKENSTLYVDTSRITDEDGIGQMALIWQRSSQRTNWENVPDQFNDMLQLAQTDVGFSYRAVVSYIDGFGTRETLVTDPSEAVANIDNPLQGEVVVRGRIVEGAELTLNTSTLSDFDGIASMASVWERSTDGRTWEAVAGSESQRSLELSQALVGDRIRARVNVVDNFGVETVVYSQATETVRNVNNKPAGRVMIRRITN